MRELMNEVNFELGKVDALLFAYEKTYLDIDGGLDDWQTIEKRDFAFYAIWDSVRRAMTMLDRLGKEQAAEMSEMCSLITED